MIFLSINLLFGAVYLSWQVSNLSLQVADARQAGEPLRPATHLSWKRLNEGLRRSIHARNRTTDATAWGGFVGLTWMAGYFATLLPMWVNQMVAVFSRQGSILASFPISHRESQKTNTTTASNMRQRSGGSSLRPGARIARAP